MEKIGIDVQAPNSGLGCEEAVLSWRALSQTNKQACAAMYLYLDEMYRKGWRELGGLLGCMSLLGDGDPADPALWEDWEKAVAAGRDPNVDINLKLVAKDEL